VLRIPASLDERLAELAARTGRSKTYHARRALDRYIEDTEDCLRADAAIRTSRKTYSSEEAKRLLGLDELR